uniref:Endonuclease/exonuclease/phosphatase domain-containing protein n=1 Tax=Chenopodium quinoa TaxID=63459 RepID=A0A803LSW9_CHEQI
MENSSKEIVEANNKGLEDLETDNSSQPNKTVAEKNEKIDKQKGDEEVVEWDIGEEEDEDARVELSFVGSEKSCANRLFVTKPKLSEQKQSEQNVQVVTKKLSEVKVSSPLILENASLDAAPLTEAPPDNILEGEYNVNASLIAKDDAVNREGEYDTDMMYVDNWGEGNEGKKIKRSWRKIEKGGSKGSGAEKVNIGVKRGAREEGIIEGTLIEREVGVAIKRREVEAMNAFKRIVITEHPQLIFLSETRLKSFDMERVKVKLGFENFFVVSCEGEGRKRRGGLAILWRPVFDITIQSFSLNHIDIGVISEVDEEWRFTGIYGYPEEENKTKTGALLEKLAGIDDKPWVCGGDFNLMLMACEKQGGNSFNVSEAEISRHAANMCNFEDLGYVGYDFTWNNNRGGEANLQERLDHFFATGKWKDLFPGSFVSHLTKRRSDHLPILLCLKKKIEIKEKKLYRKHFGDFSKEMRDCKGKMEVLMREEPTDRVIADMRAIDAGMDELEKREEVYWHQRSRQEWITSGDKNTAFFHQKA